MDKYKCITTCLHPADIIDIVKLIDTINIIDVIEGIQVFATGGIGGVHRGSEESMDISADLTELGKTPIIVVCAGVKSILDIPKTLEVLETQGVCVCVYVCVCVCEYVRGRMCECMCMYVCIYVCA